jgi:hypothetical protein
MRVFELGEGAFLKPVYLLVTVVGRFGDTYEIRHAVEPGALVTNDSATFYEGLPVEIVGDTETLVMIAYAVRADQLISKQDFDDLFDNDAKEISPDADVEDSDETEDIED